MLKNIVNSPTAPRKVSRDVSKNQKKETLSWYARLYMRWKSRVSLNSYTDIFLKINQIPKSTCVKTKVAERQDKVWCMCLKGLCYLGKNNCVLPLPPSPCLYNILFNSCHLSGKKLITHRDHQRISLCLLYSTECWNS